MYQHNDILIIGDSFCRQRTERDHWPWLLTELLTGTSHKQPPRGEGFPGGSWWSQRRCLLKELEIKVPKVLIMCHTDSNRLPHDRDLGINAVSCESKERGIPSNIARAGVEFYKHLCSTEYMHWAQTQWYAELDTIIQNHNIERVIHLRGFDECWSYAIPYEFKTGLTAEEILYNIRDDKNGYTGLIYNHFTPRNNHLIARCLYKHIEYYKTGCERLGLVDDKN